LVFFYFRSLFHHFCRLSLKHVGESGSLAEEVISTIRTAQAFGTQKILANLYDEHIEKSEKLELKSAVVHGIGLGMFFFIIYNAYALGQPLVCCYPPGRF
jgi:ATP-binding cassette subfamily B (MDR/TAP) protein 1